MEAVFLKLLNMSITASYLVIAVILLRLILKKAPKVISLILWALVGIRLILPISFESIFSLVPRAQTFPSDFATSSTPTTGSGLPILNNNITPSLPQQITPGVSTPTITPSVVPSVSESASPLQTIAFVASIVWLVGLVVMLTYSLISYIRIRRRVREAVKLEGNVMLCDHIVSPFILGIIRPKIYIPSSVSEQDMRYVLAHENAHLKRRDHFWKPFGFFLLSVYWFNPILWVAYILLCRDIELACDEKVIKELGIEVKKPYSTALVNCSVSRKAITVCPLAFGEVGVRKRVKTVLSYKKPAFWIIIVAIISCAVVAVCFLTNPPSKKNDDATTNPTNTEELKLVGSPFWSGAPDTTYLDSINCDIDGDGFTEEVRLYYGPTSGVRSYVIAVWDNKTLESVDMFSMMPGGWEFDGFADGAIRIKQTITRYNAEDEITTVMLTLNNGALTISGDYADQIYSYGMTYRNSSYTFDIDGDGAEEYCLITPINEHPYSLFRFIVWQNAGDITPKYYNVFSYTSIYSLSFAEKPDGSVVLHGKQNNEDAESITLDISVENNQIVLAQGKERLEPYSFRDDPDNFYYGYYFDERNALVTDIDGDGENESLCLGYAPYTLAYSSVSPTSSNWALLIVDNGENKLFSLGRQEPLSFKKDDYGGVYINQIVVKKIDGVNTARYELLCEIAYNNGEYSLVTEWGSSNPQPELYAVTKNANNTLSYSFADLNGNILFEMENVVREPKINMVSDNVYGLITQTGTGLSTNWAVYCDVENSQTSDIYYHVLIAKENYVICGDYKNGEHFIVVQEIFDTDGDRYYKEYKLENVSPVAADFVVDFKIDTNGDVIVKYLTGNDYTKTDLIISLP